MGRISGDYLKIQDDINIVYKEYQYDDIADLKQRVYQLESNMDDMR